MPHTRMARQAIRGIITRFMTDRHNQIAMAIQTILLRHFPVQVSNTDRFRKITGGKSHTMIPTINTLDHIFSRERMRRVAIITNSDRLMAAVVPTIKYFLHNVAVHTSLRIIREIGSPFGISKSETAQADNTTGQAS